jgi:hypothetical protein
MGISTFRSTTFVLALLAILSMPAVDAWDLNGKWICKEGGTYFVRQVDDKIWWLGEPNGSPPDPSWCNVAQGTICGDYVTLNWADVPKGTIMNSGNLVLQVATGPDGYPVMNVICVTGGFGGRSFVKPTETFNPPSNLVKISESPCKIQWTDNSNDEEGFNIYIGGSCVNCANNTAWKIAIKLC